MGPHNFQYASESDAPTRTDPLFDDLRWLRGYRGAHPEAIITYPSESPSHLWEVSLPGAATMAFGSIGAMRGALDPMPEA
jgi:hypothetical protein